MTRQIKRLEEIYPFKNKRTAPIRCRSSIIRLTISKMSVEHVEQSIAVFCFFEACNIVSGVDFFFNLFSQIPLQENFCFQISFFAGKFENAADGSRYCFFMCKRIFSNIERIGVVFLYAGNIGEINNAISVFNVADQFQCMCSFFFILFVEPFSIAVQNQVFMS